jgi:hypothetical protein
MSEAITPGKTRDEKLAAWGEGPWLDEPDRLEFRSAVGDLPCLITRQRELGHLCGYVAVPPGHPMHGKDLDAVDELVVHGGVTYANECAGEVCHVPRPGEPDDVWWLGIDCAHGFRDYSPGMGREVREIMQRAGYTEHSYKTVDYVRGELESLAAQLAERA